MAEADLRQQVRNLTDFEPRAVIKNGDTITIDISGRVLKVELKEQEIKKRLAAWKPKKPRVTKGYLARYSPTPTQ